MQYTTSEFDSKFQEIKHYQNHPQMMPFVGKDYGKFKKLLILAESHYLEDVDREYDIAKDWYTLNDIPPGDEEIY